MKFQVAQNENANYLRKKFFCCLKLFVSKIVFNLKPFDKTNFSLVVKMKG